MKTIQDFLGVRSRKEAGCQMVMERSYWTLFESSSETPFWKTLLSLRTKERPRACEGPPVSINVKPHGSQMGSAMCHAVSWQKQMALQAG